MAKLSFTRRAACAVAAGFALLGSVGAAHADVIYQGTWDPNYGSPFQGIDWSASARFIVPTLCLSSINANFGGTVNFGPDYAFSNQAGCTDLRLENALLNLSDDFGGVYTYDIGTYGTAGVPSPGDCYGEDQALVTASFVAGELVAFNTRYSCNSGFETPSGLNPAGSDQDPNIALFFLKLSLDLNSESENGTRAAHNFGSGSPVPSRNAPTNVTFNRLPEPGSAALALAALGGLLAAGRRRRG